MAVLYINRDIVQNDSVGWLFGTDGMSFDDIHSFLKWKDPADRRIDVEIHSCGGDCVEGYAIYDALRAADIDTLTCTVVGKCASMASVILLAAPAENRKIYPNARLLIHNPFIDGDVENLDFKKATELAAMLSKEREKMIGIYVERTGSTREEIEAQMEDGCWFGADRAIELGFVSQKVPTVSASAKNTIHFKYNSGKMNKKEMTLKQSVVDRLLAKCGLKSLGDLKALEVTDKDGNVLTVEREEGEPEVGDEATPDGEFLLEDGKTIVVKEGVITEIKPAEGDDVEQLKQEIERLKQEIEQLKENEKTDEENEILSKVAKAGGKQWLEGIVSRYTPAGRVQPSKQEPKTPTKLEQMLSAAREQYRSK